MNVKEVESETVNHSNSHNKSLAQRYNITANYINVANLALKVTGSLILVFFFIRSHWVDKIQYSKLDKHQLISYYFKHNLSSSFRGDNLPNLQMAEFLDAKNYKGALVYIDSLYSQDPTKVGLLLYHAYSDMCAGNYERAESQLKYFIAQKSVYSARAEYYLSGCYILNGKENQAATILKRIKKDKGYFSENAETLLYYLKLTNT